MICYWNSIHSQHFHCLGDSMNWRSYCWHFEELVKSQDPSCWWLLLSQICLETQSGSSCWFLERLSPLRIEIYRSEAAANWSNTNYHYLLYPSLSWAKFIAACWGLAHRRNYDCITSGCFDGLVTSVSASSGDVAGDHDLLLGDQVQWLRPFPVHLC